MELTDYDKAYLSQNVISEWGLDFLWRIQNFRFE